MTTPVKARAFPQKKLQIAQNPTLPGPEVPGSLLVEYDFVESQLLPLALSNGDLKVVVKWWPQISDDLYIFIDWNGTTDMASVLPVQPGQVGDQNATWEFTIPQASLTTHGRYAIRYVTSVVDDILINEQYSQPTYVLVDRKAPGGEALPYLEVFPDDPDKRTITAADLDANGNLVAMIADYFEMRQGDVVTPWIGYPTGTGEYDAAAFEVVDDDEVGSRRVFIKFSRTLLEKYGDGPVAFSYKLKDLAGNETPDHAPVVEFDVLLKTAPGNFLPPLVPANDDGLITDADARTPVVINIPKYDNAATGDLVIVHWGTHNLAAATVVVPVPPAPVPDPVLSIPISYADLKTGSPGTAPVTVNVTYTVQRGGIPFPTSGATPVKVDLSLAGGEDPDPETPEHENIKAPTVKDADGNVNRIDASNYDEDATITIPWQTVNNTQLFQPGDTLRGYWGGVATPFLTVVMTPPITRDTDYPVPSATIKADAVGDRPVWYTVTRPLSTTPHLSTAKSQVQTVLVESNNGHPGDGQPLAKPTFPEAKGTAPNQYIDRAAGLDGTTVLCPLTDTNIGAGNFVQLTFYGYDSTDGSGTPRVTFSSPIREVTGPEAAAKAISMDVPTSTMRQLCRGSARAKYTVTNNQGTGESLVSDSVRVILYNATDPLCALP